MDYSTKHPHVNNIDENHFLHFNHKNEIGYPNLLANLMKLSLLLGTEKLFMARKPETMSFSDFNPQNDQIKDKFVSKNPKNVKKYKSYEIQPTSSSSSDLKTYNHFPLNFISSITVLILNLASFQISLFVSFITFPIWCLNFSLMLVFFPLQTLIQIKDHAKHKLIKSCNNCYFALISFICNRLKSQKTMIKLAVRSGKAFFCAVYVFFVLVALLILGFVVSGIVMSNLVEESIHTTANLNFDYTKSSPVAVVPVGASFVDGVGTERRAIPYNHKLQVTVSLTLPESEYNRKLGIFQVRVESLSANGNTILGSSYPTMLRFKSQPVRMVETFLNGVPLITGLKAEVQNLKLVMKDFTEGHQPTAFFKVILEQRAEFQSGSGVPEIYGGSLEVASELPRMKRMLSNWRRTIFIWISFAVFVCEVVLFLIVFRPVVLPGGRRKGMGSKNKSDQISWYKAD